MVMKNKFGQMKIQQTAFMLIAVTLFLVLALMFFLVFKFSGLKDTANLLEKEEAKRLVTKLSNSPEFSCQESFGTIKTDCIDLDKVMALKENIETYENFWGISGVEIRKASLIEKIECNSENYPDCNYLNLLNGNGTGISNFVSLCWKDSYEGQVINKCEVGRLIVEYENK